ncbi:MBL fold metallo-hydrolase [Arenimonas composti]|uniref:Metallo-beta-lactamase domain-containing protein n=1 Tax=Arenimonas composti TR7-09 = DSM 18010 TaxID=1121013 RepID=A0A091B7R9_9GAMM|nr:MBL fold metallo-hydrolase [Arenimonas composti]KFN48713.1 hypothetical protein P873_13735 [Arenimonas composti TR7-09 = DSM 18010]
MTPLVHSFHDPATFTFTHVVYDRICGRAAVVDPVLDFDVASGRTSTASAEQVLAFLGEHRLSLDWVLETHAHADHLSAAAFLKRRTGAKVAIGRGITAVQERFKTLFGLEDDFATDGRQFDRLFDDGDTFAIGALRARVLGTPGHTSDGVSYQVGDAVFVGDTLFAPETGTARADFPGADARTLYTSLRRLLELPPETRLFLCHDYPSQTHTVQAMTTVAEQRARNIHVGGGAGEDAYVALRTTRDAALPVPKLILPALQANIRAGELPPPVANGVRYLRLPLDQI